MKPCLLCLFCLLLAGAGRAAAQKNDPAIPAKISDQIIRGTVWVIMTDHKDKGIGEGSGFLVNRDEKYIITNHHVALASKVNRVYIFFPVYRAGKPIADREYYLRNERPQRCTIIGSDPSRDLTILRVLNIPRDAVEVPLAAKSAQAGERFVAVGNPSANKVLWVSTPGTVRHVGPLRLKGLANELDLDSRLALVAPEKAMKGGYSGGPVVNAQGQLVGVVAKSNAPVYDRIETLRQFGGSLAASARGAVSFLPYLAPPREERRHAVWCVDVEEVRDVIHVVRTLPLSGHRILQPQLPGDFQDRGRHYLAKGRLEYALAAFNEMVRRLPDDPGGWCDRGRVFVQMERYAQAIDDFNKALALDPRHAEAQRERAVALHKQSSKNGPSPTAPQPAVSKRKN